MGSETISSQFAKSFYNFPIQIYTCNSPDPAIIFYPVVSSISHCKRLSNLSNFFSPFTNLDKSYCYLGYTATLTTGETLNFMDFMV